MRKFVWRWCYWSRPRALSSIFLAALLGSTGSVCAADGDLDPLWNSDGVATIGVTDTIYQGYRIALQCDGKVVVAGIANGAGESADLAVVRFNADGSLDSSFGTAGLFAINVGDFGSSGLDLAIQPDGKIVVVGTVYNDIFSGGIGFLVIRLTNGGVPDSTFSGDGIFGFNFDGSSWAQAVAIQDDGRIVIVGRTNNLSAMAVARLTTGGALDSSFSGDGKVLVDFTMGDDEAWDVVMQEDGRILVVGDADTGVGSVAVVVRLLSNGTLDTTFGSGGGGGAAINFGYDSFGRAIALQKDGKIVIAGITDSATSVAVARLTTGGLLDPTFSGDGMVTRDFNYGPDEGWDVAMQGDGRIVVAGSGYVDGLHYVALLRFTTDGTPDPTLGGYGYSLVSFGFNAFGRGVAIQPHDHKIVATGFVQAGSSESSLTVIRAIGNTDLIFAAGFECGGFSGWSSIGARSDTLGGFGY